MAETSDAGEVKIVGTMFEMGSAMSVHRSGTETAFSPIPISFH